MMTDMQRNLIILGLAVTILVPTIVWVTLAIGLYDLARDKIRQAHTEKE